MRQIMLNKVITLRSRTVAMFVNVDVQTARHVKCVGMFPFRLHKISLLISSGSLVITIEWSPKKIIQSPHFAVLNSTNKTS